MQSKYQSYLALGVTAFCVIAGAIFLFFLLFHAGDVYAVFSTIAHILRPIFMGMVLAFLLDYRCHTDTGPGASDIRAAQL